MPGGVGGARASLAPTRFLREPGTAMCPAYLTGARPWRVPSRRSPWFALLAAQLRCVARAAVRRRARQKQVCALVRDTTRSRQLFCIPMAKEPPATDEGSLLLVVRSESHATTAGGCLLAHESSSAARLLAHGLAASASWWLTSAQPECARTFATLDPQRHVRRPSGIETTSSPARKGPLRGAGWVVGDP
jgi:hypothetical protein